MQISVEWEELSSWQATSQYAPPSPVNAGDLEDVLRQIDAHHCDVHEFLLGVRVLGA